MPHACCIVTSGCLLGYKFITTERCTGHGYILKIDFGWVIYLSIHSIHCRSVPTVLVKLNAHHEAYPTLPPKTHSSPSHSYTLNVDTILTLYSIRQQTDYFSVYMMSWWLFSVFPNRQIFRSICSHTLDLLVTNEEGALRLRGYTMYYLWIGSITARRGVILLSYSHTNNSR